MRTNSRTPTRRAVGRFLVASTVALGSATASAQPAKPVAARVEPDAPLSLTATDGSGLELVSMTAQVVVQDPLAFTELHLVFRNAEDRVREGRFRITLPPSAAISRFAMKIDARWQEGEVVELQAARQAYEDFLHRRQDPALLESEAGNEFAARVFPIPARGTKDLIVSYSQELVREGDPYRLPLRGLPTLGHLSIRALVGKATSSGGKASNLGGSLTRHEVIEVDKRNHRPDHDFEVALPSAGTRMGLRHDNLVVARVTPVIGSLPADPVRSLAVLIDTSASRALGFEEQANRVAALLSELRKRDGDPAVEVIAFDQTVESLYTGKTSGVAAVLPKLLARRALGASDLDRALAALAGRKGGLRASRLLLVSDGVVTAGEIGNDKLRARVEDLKASGLERMDVLAMGGIRDDERLARLVTASLPRAGVVIPADAAPQEAARRLGLATRSQLKIEVEGASWVWPQRLDGVQPGDQVLVYADLPAAKAFRLTIDGRTIGAGGGLASVERPLLERAWIKARLGRLLAQRDALAATDADLAEGLRKQVIELSVQHRVLSPYTALLVLETEADYRRFGIARRGLADVLAVGLNGVTVLDRRSARPAAEVAVERLSRPADLQDQSAELTEATPGRKREGSATGRAASAVAPRAPSPMVGQSPALGNVGRSGATIGTGTAGGGASPPRALARATDRRAEPQADVAAPLSRSFRAQRAAPQPPLVAPYEGAFAEVMALLAAGNRGEALTRALAWRQNDQADVLALIALGEAAEATGDATLAARAYGSIIDLFPGRADLRRFAGNRLERLKGTEALALAIDSYRKAVEQRPDHPAGHRLLAFALVKMGRAEEAFSVLATGVARAYPDGRFVGVDRILREDLGLVAAAWAKAAPNRAADVRERLERAGGVVAKGPSQRFVLTWETDANDVDFHIHDGRGGHAFYSQRTLPSGGELYADVTTGYGPECFTVPGSPRGFPYKLQAHYYSRGPMGYGMGKLQVVEHDGRGGLRFEERPFVVMRDGAYVDLGTVKSTPAVATSPGGGGTVLAR